jgi:LysM repeat protein
MATAPVRLPFTAAQLVNRLCSQTGITEAPAGSNRQPYSAALGRPPQPWCADFLMWGMFSLGWDGRERLPLFSSCSHLMAGMSALGWLAVRFDDVRAGDVLFFSFARNGIVEHVETATGPAAKGTVPTVGGNTSAAGETRSQSNGGRVAQRIRYAADVIAIRRPLYAVPAVPKPTSPAHPSARYLYTVKAGDSLVSIAARHKGLTWQAIYAANKAAIGPNPNALRINTRLVLPGVKPQPTTTRVVRVHAGDSLSSIAGRYGLTWQALYKANRAAVGPNPNALRIGMTLRVPR